MMCVRRGSRVLVKRVHATHSVVAFAPLVRFKRRGQGAMLVDGVRACECAYVRVWRVDAACISCVHCQL